MEEFNGAKQRTHKLTLNNRRSCTVTGVVDVLSFDVSEIMLETDQGMLMIREVSCMLIVLLWKRVR